jgi:transposase
MLQLVNSTVQDVSRKEEVGYDAVEGAIERHIQVTVDWTQFDSLRVVGIDEIALTKGKKNFVAIISTQQADGHVAILAVLANREKKTVRQFLDSIPERLWPTMETVCTDMWDGYVNAAKEFAKAHRQVSIKVVIDRFHVAKNYRDDVDTLRKKECRRLKKELSKSEYEEIKGVMWNSRQNNRNLAPDGRRKLNLLFEHSPDLKLAYTLREELTAIFEMSLTRAEGKMRLEKWRDKVARSGSACFTKFLKTLDNWLDGIV